MAFHSSWYLAYDMPQQKLQKHGHFCWSWLLQFLVSMLCTCGGVVTVILAGTASSATVLGLAGQCMHCEVERLDLWNRSRLRLAGACTAVLCSVDGVGSYA